MFGPVNTITAFEQKRQHGVHRRKHRFVNTKYTLAYLLTYSDSCLPICVNAAGPQTHVNTNREHPNTRTQTREHGVQANLSAVRMGHGEALGVVMWVLRMCKLSCMKHKHQHSNQY
jgi:hypothetical protein